MPDTPTTRLGLYKSKSDGSEDVDYTQDIGQNLDKLDAAAGFQPVTSSTRPSSPYSGKGIRESDTGRTYIHNGSSPASAGWVQIPNAASTFDANLGLSSGRQINIGGSGSTAAYAILLSDPINDFAISSRVSGDSASRSTLRADGQLGWGPGTASTDTFLARAATGRLALTGTNAALTIGSATYRNAVSPTAAFTISNSASEAVIHTNTIPAGDAVAGAIYRLRAWGTMSTTGTPAYTVRGRLGGLSGALAATTGATTTGSTITNQFWTIEFMLVCRTVGASAVWAPYFVQTTNGTGTGQTGTTLMPTSWATITQDSTVANDMVITWQWLTANAANTASRQGATFERVA